MATKAQPRPQTRPNEPRAETDTPPRYSDAEIQAWADACNACDNCLDRFDDDDEA